MKKVTILLSRIWAAITSWCKKLTIKHGAISGVVIIALTVITLCCASKTELGNFDSEHIGDNGLCYKYGSCIFDPKTDKVLIDSIDWLYYDGTDSIGILAKNGHRAYINLNTAELLTSLTYDKAWAFRCDRGVMSRNDTLFIFRRDGSLVNPKGLKHIPHYYEELIFVDDKLIVETDKKRTGIIDTSANFILPPVYSEIDYDYYHRMFTAKAKEEYIIFNNDLDTVAAGDWKSIDIAWSSGIIVTEHNGIQRLLDYDGKLLYEVVYRDIEPLTYSTGAKDANFNDIQATTECFVYVDYHGRRGLMDKNHHIITPPLFSEITARSKNIFFAKFEDGVGTLIDSHGNQLR